MGTPFHSSLPFIIYMMFILILQAMYCDSLFSPFVHGKILHEEDITITGTTGDNEHRNKRSIGSVYPSILKFNVTFGDGENKQLLFERSRTVHIHVPVYVVKNDKVVPEDIPYTEETVFYKDVQNLAAVGIQYVDLGHKWTYAMSGTILKNNRLHVIHPRSADEQTTGSADIKHSLQTSDFNYNFKGDSIKLDDDIPLKKSKSKFTGKSTGTYIVEFLSVVDYAVYNFWYTKSSEKTDAEKDKDAKAKIQQFYAYVINSIDVIYSSITGVSWSIDIAPAGIIIADSAAAIDVTESVKHGGTGEFDHFVPGYTALTNFGDWLEEHGSSIPHYDHAMFFTGYDMYSTTTGLLGMAWVKRICSRDMYGTYLENSITEDSFGAQITLVAAHELGHNVGADHDGDGNLCSTDDKFNMAPSIGATVGEIGKNAYIFSSCSVSYFDSYITDLNNNAANCMATLGTDYDANWFSPYDSTFYGQIYSAEEQCRIISPFGDNSYVCRNLHSNINELCTHVYCYEGYCSRHFPWDGTQCDRNKICIGGECVTDSRATNVSETCVFGDDPDYRVDNMRCEVLIVNSSIWCYERTVENECCWSCAKAHTGKTGCEYGDHVSGCLVSSCPDYSQDVLDQDCCETCYNYGQTNSASTTETVKIETTEDTGGFTGASTTETVKIESTEDTGGFTAPASSEENTEGSSLIVPIAASVGGVVVVSAAVGVIYKMFKNRPGKVTPFVP